MSEHWIISAEDPRSDDVRALLLQHLAFSHSHTPAPFVYALDVEGLVKAEVTFFCARSGSQLLGVGALRQLDPRHAELKSMHTLSTARGKGIGRAMLVHLLQEARARGLERVSLETSTMPAYEPARSLYRSAGFRDCAPFGEYQPNPYSVCMTLKL